MKDMTQQDLVEALEGFDREWVVAVEIPDTDGTDGYTLVPVRQVQALTVRVPDSGEERGFIRLRTI